MPEFKINLGEKEIIPVAAMGEQLHRLENERTLEPVLSSETIKSVTLQQGGKIDYLMESGETWNKSNGLLFATREEAAVHWTGVIRGIVSEQSQKMEASD